MRSPNSHGLLPAIPVLQGILFVAALVSCRLTGPVRKPEAGARAPQAVPPGAFLDAAAAGDLDRARELLERNPQLLESEDETGWDALSYAAWNARDQLYEYLLQRGAEGNLFTEAALGPWESFRQRLETNPMGVDSRDGRYRATPLIWAVRTGNQAGCELLLLRGGDVLARDREGKSVLHHAVEMGRAELIDFLLTAGADVGATDDQGRTALHMASAIGDFETCRLLLDSGASLDRADVQGNTPLHIAAGAGNFELCEYFLFLGARALQENRSGQTPLDLAAAAEHDRVVRLLEAQMR